VQDCNDSGTRSANEPGKSVQHFTSARVAMQGEINAGMQATNADITQKYLCDFRLVWRSLLDRLSTVAFKSVEICQARPEVFVDAVRSVCLLDAVVEVSTPKIAQVVLASTCFLARAAWR
jgi:hypothetical protein